MLRVAADEDFDNDILRGLLRLHPDIDIVRVQDAGLSGESDPVILDWITHENRILLTHDANTMPKHAYKRIEEGQDLPGVFVVNRLAPFGSVIDDILLLVEVSREGEWAGQILFVPISKDN